MACYVRGLLLGGLVSALAAGCGFFEDEETDDGDEDAPYYMQATGGEQAVAPGTPVPGAGGAGDPAATGMGGTGTGAQQQQTTGSEACATLVGLDECGSQSQEAQWIETNILLVMDKSGSMATQPPGYALTKWDGLKAALAAALSGVQDKIGFGLELFPTTATGTPIEFNCVERCCEMPEHVDMNVNVYPAGPDAVPLIIQALDATGPAGGTPIARALQRAHGYFTGGAGAAVTGERYVLLATDGGPNCNPNLACEIDQCTVNIDGTGECTPTSEYSCCYNNPQGCLDQYDTVQRINDLMAIGVKTIVVGIPGSELYAGNLDEFAQAGGQENPNGPMAYYEVAAAGGVEALTATFTEITRALLNSCEIVIPPEQQIQDLNKVNVAINCEVLPKERADGSGWSYMYDANGRVNAIQITGPACEQIQEQGVDRIDTVFDCATVLT